jgi:hypothetical protein
VGAARPRAGVIWLGGGLDFPARLNDCGEEVVLLPGGTANEARVRGGLVAGEGMGLRRVAEAGPGGCGLRFMERLGVGSPLRPL